MRAHVVLHAARGRSNARIARETGLHLDTVRTWRGRFAEQGLAGLADHRRSGRPASFTPLQVAEAKAMACQLPAETGVPLSRWSCPELAAELTARGITDSVSASTVRRWLREDVLKPWQCRSWIFIRDPSFRAKAQRVLDLYARTFEGVPLGEDEYVISSDEKTSVQARCRCHPTLAPGRARAMRVNHEYGRGGALAYLAAYDVHQAKVFGRCEPKTGIVPFMDLVEQVMTQEPYASARRVFWIVDNGSSHRGKKAIDRLTAAFPNAVMVHTPVHASWTNQIEIFFSIVQRVRRPPQRHGTAVPVEVHHLRPGRSAGPARPTHTRRPTRRILRRPGSLINSRRTFGADHLVTTWHHPFWDATHHHWTDAHNLTPGTKLRQADGTTVVIRGVRNFHQHTTTYDLTVGTLHTYYVLAGATPVLVHNCNGGTTVYRGAAEISGETGELNPAFDDAVEGIARPRGGTSSPELHQLGHTDSEYTSWTTSEAAAIRAATKGGGNGVVLKGSVPPGRFHIHPNDEPWGDSDLRGAFEVIIQGEMRGTPRAVWPGAGGS
ncbi:intein C-terminal splicing region [Streptomyces mirabilis]|jgi:transposase|uniref:Intein C-terminal splicing region n=2 Tax=Streptomyces mirabilis TaxID=68239 RepID=A0A1I2Y0K6_9ACTN|nr:intein C-terminal splicing region [Streptomyces mirabilis]